LCYVGKFQLPFSYNHLFQFEIILEPPPPPKKKLFPQTPIHTPFETKSPVGHGILHLFLVRGYPNVLPPSTARQYLPITPPQYFWQALFPIFE